ncbi:hypothetical protein VN97_g11890 [Penicillium thymicola]|uniref:Uncharacterized protein n=1 Tax=Penicillium thymicola TaxID=293382 RepID=A0AAI9T788_PENTH|nr:hypothetical protein VN97_g11890 [Penicillium thymicola]
MSTVYLVLAHIGKFRYSKTLITMSCPIMGSGSDSIAQADLFFFPNFHAGAYRDITDKFNSSEVWVGQTCVITSH